MNRAAMLSCLAMSALSFAVLVSCTTSTPPTPQPDGPVTATILPEGGTLVATGRDDSSLRLNFPAGAVLEPLDVTITPTDADDVRARFMLEPFAVRFRQPIEIRLSVAAGTSLAGSSLFLGSGADRVPLPSTIDTANGVVSASTRQLGFAFDADATTSARLQTGTSGPIDFADVSCTIAIGHLSEARTRAAQDWLKTVASAQAIRDAYLTMLTACDVDADDEASFQAARDILQEVVCDGYRDARVNTVIYNPAIGNGTPEDFWRLTESLVSWAASIQLIGAECATPTALEEDLEGLFDAYVDDYARRLEALDIDVWRTLWNVELANVVRLLGDAESFGLDATRTRTEEALVQRLFERLRTAAYERCREDQAQGYLADIRNGGGHIGAVVAPGPPRAAWLPFDIEDIDTDIQLCASQFTVQVFDDVPSLLSTHELGGGETPGDHEREATLNMSAGGALLFSGTIRALRCQIPTAPTRWSDDALVARFEGAEAGRRTHTNGDFLHTSWDFPLADMLAAAGLPEDAEGPFTLTLERQGEACGGSYGQGTSTLVTLELVLDGSLAVTVDAMSVYYGVSISLRPSGPGEGNYVESVQHDLEDYEGAISGAGAGQETDGDGQQRLASAEGTTTVGARSDVAPRSFRYDVDYGFVGSATSVGSDDSYSEVELDGFARWQVDLVLDAAATMRWQAQGNSDLSVWRVTVQRIDPFSLLLRHSRSSEDPDYEPWAIELPLEPGTYSVIIAATSYLTVCDNPRQPWVCGFDAAGALDNSFSASFELVPAGNVSAAASGTAWPIAERTATSPSPTIWTPR